MPARTERKIIRTGSSSVVALPADWLRALKLKPGDIVDVLYDSIIVIKPRLPLDYGLMKKELEILVDIAESFKRREK